jgi:putative membrane protein
MHHDHGGTLSADVILGMPFAAALVIYLAAVAIGFSRGRSWPCHRTAAWVAGIIAAASGFVGPLTTHDDFVTHMWTHLLVGMVAPLLLVAAAPMTLALRTMDITAARRLSRVLGSWPARFLTAPIVAATLNVGGMWALYFTPVFEQMQASMLMHLLVMTHFLIAGYLFTAAIIPFDPAPHQARYATRMVVLILALAAHSVLAKMIYAYPPVGVASDQAQTGAMLMFYAGDFVDVLIITILCARWYRSTDPNRRSAAPGRRLRTRRSTRAAQ